MIYAKQRCHLCGYRVEMWHRTYPPHVYYADEHTTCRLVLRWWMLRNGGA